MNTAAHNYDGYAYQTLSTLNMASSAKRTDDMKFRSIADCTWNHSAMALTADNHLVKMLEHFDSDMDDNGKHEKLTEQLAE